MDDLDRLRQALDRFTEERFPVNHAMLSVRVGTHLLAVGDPAGAAEALERACTIYADGLPLERARALNVLGAALRDLGRQTEAEAAFVECARVMRDEGQHAEVGIALYNLGLAQLDLDRPEQARTSFESAIGTLDPRTHPGEAAAALRELGRCLLTDGHVDEAATVLERSIDLSVASGDRSGLGAAANLLGLARLAVDDPESAADLFAESASAHPVSVRPEAHAMAKANLARALEASGDGHRARQAARHALTIPSAPGEVQVQCEALLGRLGADYDLHVVLDGRDREQWPGIMRDETRHWTRLGPTERNAIAQSWLRGLVGRSDRADRLAAAFAAALELTTDGFTAVADSISDGWQILDVDQTRQYAQAASRAAATFGVPQMKRLEAAFIPSSHRPSSPT